MSKENRAQFTAGMTMDWLKPCRPVGTNAGGGDITLGVAYRFAYKGGSSVSYSGKLGTATGCVTIVGGYRLAAIPTGTLSLEDKIMSLGPVAYLKLDEGDKSDGAQAQDSSGNGRHGAYHGRCSVTDGPIEGSIATLFDGITGYVQIPDDDAFSVPTSGHGLTVLRFVRAEVMRFTPNSDSSGVPGMVTGGPYRLPASTIQVSYVGSLSPRGFITVIASDSSVVRIDYTKTDSDRGEIQGCSTPNGTGKTISPGAATLQNDAFVYSNTHFNVIPGNGKQPVRIGTRTQAAYFGGAVGQWAVFGRVLKDQEVYRLFLARTNVPPTPQRRRIKG
jgi:hypothetical protein